MSVFPKTYSLFTQGPGHMPSAPLYPPLLRSGSFGAIARSWVRIIQANLSWSRTRVKFCLLIASLSVILLQLKLTKLKLEVRKSDFQRKKERYERRYTCN